MVAPALRSAQESRRTLVHWGLQLTLSVLMLNVFQPLFGRQEAQLRAGTVSRETVLTQQRMLLQAEQNWRDTQGQLSQGSVALIQSLGGGWQAVQ